MEAFSEESLLIMGNWETVSAIMQAVQRLNGELASIIRRVRRQVEGQPWWSREWIWEDYSGGNGLHVCHRGWRSKAGASAALIELAGFTADGVLGLGAAPTLAVWSSNREISRHLLDQLEECGAASIGELDRARDNNYVIRHAVQKCLPEEVESYADQASEQILGFVSHYATALWGLDDKIRAHLQG